MRRFLLGLSLLVSACDSGPLTVDPDEWLYDPALLVGTWDLRSVTSSGYGAPVTTTPASELDESVTYTFRADGTVDVVRDGVLAQSAMYAVEVLPDVSPTPRLRIGTETDYERLFFGVTADRFYIDGRPADGSLAEYARR